MFASCVVVMIFAAFRASACTAPSTIRNLRRIAIDVSQAPVITLEVDGNAFLHNMVRIVAGTLVDVGRGRFTPADIAVMLAGRDRTKAGRTAPAQGLTLDDVLYGPPGARQGLDYKNLLAHMEAARQVD